ncbi:guanine deaminase [Rhizosaccharibacter radicis]|uniref:Guanine deaminase n=1 Tax=Rhizosaccharibacter radicis TaxID=2782605 RepID=A0ABT1VUP2_9PROT|nr:guanine deaminase [Acetobacteraceae bacterium KSS12]
MTAVALRGQLLSLRTDPFLQPSAECLAHETDGAVLLREGLIEAAGSWDAVRPVLPPGTPVVDYGDALIVPGFVDAHVHYPQLSVIGAFGEELLPWLERYVFPAEARFADPAHAERVAALFLRELLRAGTTTAAVYCTVHPESVDAFFRQSERFDTRMVAGKVLMDRNAPPELRDDVRRGHDDSQALIGRWHGRGRQCYAVTPRFAPSCSPEQLEMAGALLRQHDGLFLQTHLSENRAEVDWVRDLFPDARDYLDVYDRAGLVGPRSVFGHAIHLGERELCRCHEAHAAFAHCPTSNLFLGSGAFDLFRAAADRRRPVRVGLGTDVGAGTSLFQLRTLGEAYKVAHLHNRRLDAVQSLWLATAGGARALHLDHRVGRIEAGLEADLCVLDPRATPLLAFRAAQAETVSDLLFALTTLADERCVRATWVAGRPVYDRDRTVEPFREASVLESETAR